MAPGSAGPVPREDWFSFIRGDEDGPALLLPRTLDEDLQLCCHAMLTGSGQLTTTGISLQAPEVGLATPLLVSWARFGMEALNVIRSLKLLER